MPIMCIPLASSEGLSAPIHKAYDEDRALPQVDSGIAVSHVSHAYTPVGNIWWLNPMTMPMISSAICLP